MVQKKKSTSNSSFVSKYAHDEVHSNIYVARMSMEDPELWTTLFASADGPTRI